MNEDNPAVIIDNGSGSCKVGLSGDDTPRGIIPSIVGRPKMLGLGSIFADKDKFVGKEAQSKRGILSFYYPIEHGIITNWDDMETIWYHCLFNELRVIPEEHSALLTETPMNPKQNREKMTQIFFEGFSVPKFYVSSTAPLSIYPSGNTTGILLDSGEGVTSIVKIVDGYSIPKGCLRFNFGGGYLTDMFALFSDNGLVSNHKREIFREVKEKLAYVALDYEAEMRNYFESEDKIYELPDGSPLNVGKLRFACPEVLFKPMGIIGKGVHELIFESIMKCEEDIRKDLFRHIIISGGTTMIPGFVERINKEMVGLTSSSKKIIAPPDRKYSAFLGGNILTSLSTFSNSWITKDEYDENGPGIVNKKCLI